jgi:hypothetical protein
MSDAAGPDGLAPRQPRQNVLLSAEISGFGGGTPSKHRIRDLSSTGARIDRAGSLKTGSTVLVSVGLLDQVGATVIWVRGDTAGLKFAEAVDPDAARSKAIVAPPQKATLKREAPREDGTLEGGWASDLRSPYRK